MLIFVPCASVNNLSYNSYSDFIRGKNSADARTLLMASEILMIGFAAYGNTVCRQMAALT